MNFHFAKFLFLNINVPEKRYRIFRNKVEIDELLEDSADIFQHNMLDRYIDRLDENLMGGKYSTIDAMCFAEFLLYYKKSIKDIECDCQPIVLDIELMGSKYAKCSYPKVIPLMSSKEKLKCRNVKTDLRYHQPSPNRDTKKLVNHMPFSFYPFRTEEYLMLPPITGTILKNFKNQEFWI